MTSDKLTKEQQIGVGEMLSAQKRGASSFPMHTHDYFELEIVLSGTGVHILNNLRIPIQRGSILFLTPADCHAVEVDGELELWNISFDERAVSEKHKGRISHSTLKRCCVEEDMLLRLCTAAQLIEREGASTGCVMPLLEYMISLLFDCAPTEPVTAMGRALLFADTHFREDPSVSEAASVACLSTVYFGAVFKRTYGVGFRKYINKKKAAFAKALLEGGMSVAQACYESGFNSLSNFARVFREEYGVCAKDYKIGSEQP